MQFKFLVCLFSFTLKSFCFIITCSYHCRIIKDSDTLENDPCLIKPILAIHEACHKPEKSFLTSVLGGI